MGNKRVCKFFQQGSCKKGKACNFYHNVSESSHAAANQCAADQNAHGESHAKDKERSETRQSQSQQHSLLTALTRREEPLANQHAMARFVNAIRVTLIDCHEPAFVLDCLASTLKNSKPVATFGLLRVKEVCTECFTTTAGSKKSPASFQRVLVPFLDTLAQPALLHSPLDDLRNVVVSRVIACLDWDVIAANLQDLCNKRSIDDPNYKAVNKDQCGLWQPTSWREIASPIASWLNLMMVSFRSQLTGPKAESVRQCLLKLQQFVAEFAAAQPLAGSKTIAQDVQRLIKIQDGFDRQLSLQQERDSRRAQAAQQRAVRQKLFTPCDAQDQGSGPGTCREAGPRHDNDHADVAAIHIIPTQEEVLCTEPPYLPRNIPGTSLHLTPGTAAAHLDTHFRLLRHDLVAPLCNALQLYYISRESQARQRDAQGRPKKSGKFVPPRAGAGGDVNLFVYQGVVISDFQVRRNSGVCFMVEFDDLPFNARRGVQARQEYWSRSKRLQHGSLVCLSFEDGTAGAAAAQPSLLFAVVSVRDVKLLAGKSDGRPRIGLSVPAADSRGIDKMLWHLAQHESGAACGSTTTVAMLQSGVQLFAYEPVLAALQNGAMPPALEPYLAAVPQDSGAAAASAIAVDPPAYVEEVEGSGGPLLFNLAALVDKEKLAASGEAGKAAARQLRRVNVVDKEDVPLAALEQVSTLDRSQLDALLACLRQSVALIQGPPGTGKTFLGIMLVEVLLGNTRPTPKARSGVPLGAVPLEEEELHELPPLEGGQRGLGTGPAIGPILCVCFTNHALDQFLEGLLDSGVKDIVRIGGRSKSERLVPYNLLEIVKGDTAGRTQKRLKWERHTALDAAEAAVREAMEQLQFQSTDRSPAWNEVDTLLLADSPTLWESLASHGDGGEDSDSDEGVYFNPIDNWKMWVECKDLRTTTAAYRFSAKGGHMAIDGGKFSVLDEDSAKEITDGTAGVRKDGNMQDRNFGKKQAKRKRREQTKPVESDRPLAELLAATNAWSLSRKERRRLVSHWCQQIQVAGLEDVKAAISRYTAAQNSLKQVQHDVDLNVLRQARVIGMTTSGMASLQRLVRAVGSKVIIVEEAAEVLESHVLASLTPQAEHLVLIGDHEQLRPKVGCYALSMDSGRGFNLDMSLFERLVRQSGFPVATLQQQHRMRPQISRLIRETIYPQLKDHPSVVNTPSICGMVHNVFFLNHSQPEGGVEEDSTSKYNDHEVDTVVALARYLVQQGYSPRQISILTPYLGQLSRLRKAMARQKLMVNLDERDAEMLAEIEEDGEGDGGSVSDMQTSVREIKLGDGIRVVTIDNFQGEEADIVILSLVRSNKDNRVGFIKMQNRVNVLLSRARQGMYIVGNATCLVDAHKSEMWPKVISMLREDGCVGDSLPLRCENHGTVTHVTNAADFQTHVVDGGCAASCGFRMPCGHTCPRLCHIDDRSHKVSVCHAPCDRLHQPCGHVCSQLCGEKHSHRGVCPVQVAVGLPCGHVKQRVECHRAQQPDRLSCLELVRVHMAHCGHDIKVRCHEADAVRADPAQCSALCGLPLDCGHNCTHSCGSCTARTAAPAGVQPADLQQGDERVPRRHGECAKECGRALMCGHACQDPCHASAATPCPPCNKNCVVSCLHSKCSQPCKDNCSQCAEPCAWQCPHQGPCTLPCGMPCARLPCNRRCDSLLPCGHRCPLVCGELCPDTKRWCIKCGSPDIQVEDMIMLETKSLTQLTEDEVDEDPLIRLPCRHLFPLSTMDGHMGLADVYEKDGNGDWVKPLPLEGGIHSGGLKSCPTCRQPVLRIMRYGRVINNSLLQLISLKYLQNAQRQLQLLGRQLDGLKASLDNARSKNGVRNFVRQGTSLHRSYQQLAEECMTPPMAKAYDAARAAIVRNIQRNDLIPDDDMHDGTGELVEADVARLLIGIGRHHPDVRPMCRALIGCSKALMLGSEADLKLLNILESEYDTTGPADHPSVGRARKLLQRMEKSWAAVDVNFDKAVASCDQHKMLRLQASALHAHAQSLVERSFMLDRQRTALVAAATRSDGSYVELCKDIQTAQVRNIKVAEQQCTAAVNVLVGTHKDGNGVVVDTDLLSAVQECIKQLPEIKEQLVNKASVEAERLEIIRALVAAEPSLVDAGYSGTGHMYYCRNGHPYLIGDCGGAQQVGRCIECGVAIGGRSYQLEAGNRPADDLRALALHQAHQR